MPAPGNNDFTNATNIDVSSPGTVAGTTFDATKEATEPAFQSNDQSVWYRIIPTSTGWYKFWIEDDGITVHNGRGLGLVLGSPTTLAGFTTSAVESRVDNPNSFTPTGFWEVSGYLTASSTYYIKVYASKPGTINDQTADFTLNWAAFTPPANNDFASAETLSLPDSAAFDTFDCTHESGEPVISPGFYTAMQSCWYKFTAAASTWYSARLLVDDFVFTGNHIDGMVGGIEQNPGFIYIQAFNASVDTLAEATEANALAVNSIQNTSTNDASIQFQTTTAGTYYIRVSTPYIIKATSNGIPNCFNGHTVATTLELEVIPAPSNDNFADAEVVTTTPIVGTTYGATEEASEQPFSGTDQSVWYEFSPPTDGNYLFSINETTGIVDHNVSGGTAFEVAWAIYDAAVVTTPALATNENMFHEPYNYQVVEPGGDTYAAVYCIGMLAANTYVIKVSSRMTSTFNGRTADFELDWVFVPIPDNDDFADAEAISGANSNVTGTALGSTFEAGTEPASYYWNGVDQGTGTVWYDWTCPSTGDYVFKVESNDPGTAQAVGPYADLAIWQGATLAGLTKVTRNWAGSQNTTGVRVNNAATAVGFHATSGQHYKIQISGIDGFKLSWRTNTVVHNTTATAGAFPDGRIDNYGNDDTEPPPNFDTILAGHDSWWFDEANVGGVKWFKRVFSVDELIEIRGVQFDGSAYSTNVMNTTDIGLICYKGANYASLVVADEVGTGDDAAMMIEASDFLPDGIGLIRASFKNQSATRDYMLVDCEAGETLWIAVFGLVDIDPGTGDGTPEDATQFELDIHVPTAAPANDAWDDVWDNYNYPYNLSKGEFPQPDGDWTDAYAIGRSGTTVAATAEVGELARAGFAATRSVWYVMDPNSNDTETWTLTVDSAVDCVLGVYEVTNGSGVLGSLILQDDDSGTGDAPQITFVPETIVEASFGYGFAVVVDSKTEGAFDLLLSRATTGTPPANDNFDDAEVHTGGVWNATGQTTVGATAEFFEPNAEWLGYGPKDSVWYKWTPNFTGHARVHCVCTSDNEDGYVYLDVWEGDTLDELTQVPSPPKNFPKGTFVFGQTEAQTKANGVLIDIVNGQDYYIRVQTEEGGSEDFEIYVEEVELYINIQPSGVDEMHGTLLDDAEVYLNIQLSSVEDFHMAHATDAATVFVDIQPSGVEFMAKQYTDVASVYYNIQIDSHDCQTKWEPSQLVARSFDRFEHIANHRWLGTTVYDRFEVVAGDGLEEC